MHALGEPRARPITVISEMNRIESIQPVQNEIGISGAQAMPEPTMARLSRFAVAQHLSGCPGRQQTRQHSYSYALEGWNDR